MSPYGSYPLIPYPSLNRVLVVACESADVRDAEQVGFFVPLIFKPQAEVIGWQGHQDWNDGRSVTFRLLGVELSDGSHHRWIALFKSVEVFEEVIDRNLVLPCFLSVVLTLDHQLYRAKRYDEGFLGHSGAAFYRSR